MDERSGGMSWDKALSDEMLGDEPKRDAAGLTAASGVGTATGVGAADDPEEIRAQIEETRAGMSQTIDAIQERLSPENLKEQAKEQVEVLTEQAKEKVEEIADQAKDKLKEAVQETVQTAKDAVYDATIGKAGEVMQNVGETVSDAAQQVGTTIRDTGSSVVRSVRTNPLPFALMGLGLGMLLLRRNRPRYESYDDYDVGADWGYERGHTTTQGQSRGTVSRAQEAVGDFVGGAKETVSNAASGAVNTVSNVASQARDQVGNLASRTADQMSNLGTQIQHGARRVQGQYQQSLQENPLAVGAVALAAGAAVGLMLPSTRMEDQWMGETRENLTQMAEQAARGTIEKVQQVASEAGRAARKEAEYQGLTG
ncbi:MAG TPA: DUF3618 domain-containing protein [Pyrinomonadaceae bacterium]|jgi:gas vesicle protein|nr:DUF3618 domain-containing protein [Pyrinomonadaceae bacterium]